MDGSHGPHKSPRKAETGSTRPREPQLKTVLEGRQPPLTGTMAVRLAQGAHKGRAAAGSVVGLGRQVEIV